MRWPLFATALLMVGAVLACSHRHELSADERQHARDNEVASFANANGASVVPDIKDAGVTLDWQKALRGSANVFAFRGSVDDIFERDQKYFLKVSDIDHKLLWMIQCSEAQANDVRSQRDKALEDLFVAEVTEIRPVISEDSITEVTGRLRKFQLSAVPL
ncbi:MAG: hypothetical protein WBV69_19905 [Candidatus Sulfotelmatobacter sp.]